MKKNTREKSVGYWCVSCGRTLKRDHPTNHRHGHAVPVTDRTNPRPSVAYDYASSETAYGQTIGYPFALKVF